MKKRNRGGSFEETVVCGRDPERHLGAIAEYAERCLHQVGSDQAGFMPFQRREIVPKLRSVLTG